MIVAQSRGINFKWIDGNHEEQPGWWIDRGSARLVFDDMVDSLNLGDEFMDYLETLTKEGLAFRKRFVAFVEAADGS